MNPFRFDYEGASKAGYSDDDIAIFLGEKAGYDSPAALESGLPAGEIINFIRRGGGPADTSNTFEELVIGPARGTVVLPGQVASFGEALTRDINAPDVQKPTQQEQELADIDIDQQVEFKRLPKTSTPYKMVDVKTEDGPLEINTHALRDPQTVKKEYDEGNYIAPDQPWARKEEDNSAPGYDTAFGGEFATPPETSTDIDTTTGSLGMVRKVISALGIDKNQPEKEDILNLYQYIRDQAYDVPDPETAKAEYQAILTGQGEEAAAAYQHDLAQKMAKATPMPKTNKYFSNDSWVMKAPAALAEGLTTWGEEFLFEHPELDMARDIAEIRGVGEAWEKGMLGRYAVAHAAESIPQMALNIGINAGAAFAGVPGIGFAISASLMGAMEGGSSYQALIRSGVSKNDAADVSTVVAVINGLLEQVPMEGLIHGGGGRVFRKLLGKKVLKSLANRPEFTRRILNGLIGGAGQMMEEGVTEGLQEIVSNAASAVIDENATLMQNVPTSMLVGALMGVVSGGVSGAWRNPSATNINKSLEDTKTKTGGQLNIKDIDNAVREAGSYLEIAQTFDDSDVGDYARMKGRKKYKKEFKDLLKQGIIDEDGKIVKTNEKDTSLLPVGSPDREDQSQLGDINAAGNEVPPTDWKEELRKAREGDEAGTTGTDEGQTKGGEGNLTPEQKMREELIAGNFDPDFIENKVKDAGSLEAVHNIYPDDSTLVRAYARRFAESLYGKGETKDVKAEENKPETGPETEAGTTTEEAKNEAIVVEAPNEGEAAAPKVKPAENLWNKTPGDLVGNWGEMMSHVSDIQNEPKIKVINDELESLKNSRKKEDVARKKELRTERNNLEAMVEIAQSHYEGVFVDSVEKFTDEAIAKAKKQGLDEKDVESFRSDLNDEISGQRPYIENNHKRNITDIYDDVLSRYVDLQSNTPQEGVSPEKADSEETAKAETPEKSTVPIDQDKEGKKETSKSPAEMTLDEFEQAGHRPADVSKEEWVNIMRRHRRSLGQPEESGTRGAPYADYENYWEQDVKEAQHGAEESDETGEAVQEDGTTERDGTEAEQQGMSGEQGEEAVTIIRGEVPAETPGTLKTPFQEGMTPFEKFKHDLENKGAARTPSGKDYKIISTDNGFAYTETEDGARVTKGGAARNKWSIQTARDKVIEAVKAEYERLESGNKADEKAAAENPHGLVVPIEDIPTDMKVMTSVVGEESGRQATAPVNAREAVEALGDLIEKLNKVLDCVKT